MSSPTKKELLERINALELRIAVLESRPTTIINYPVAPYTDWWYTPVVTYTDTTKPKLTWSITDAQR